MRKRLFAAIVPLLLVGLTPAGFSSDHSILGVVTDINGSVVGSASVTAHSRKAAVRVISDGYTLTTVAGFASF
jgi:hypothetical protein